MKHILRKGMAVAALLAVACMKDGPVSPHGNEVALHVQLQRVAAGQAVHVSVVSFLPDSEEVRDTLFDDTFAVTQGSQQLTVGFDLTRCLAAMRSVNGGTSCTIAVEVDLVVNGEVVDQQFLGTMDVSPGQVVNTAPLVLVAGNNPPVITAINQGLIVEPSLIRYQITGSDPDGDIIGLITTAMSGDVTDRTTLQPFYPPLANLDGYYYAFNNSTSEINELLPFLTDSKFNASQVDTVPVSFAESEANADSMTVDTTADSLIVRARTGSDSMEVVVRNLMDDRPDTLYFVCGGSTTVQDANGMRRVACARTVPFTQAVAFVVPIDDLGNPGQGMHCTVPNTTYCAPPFLPNFDRRRR